MICIQQKMIENENILNKNENLQIKNENKDKYENKLIIIQNKIETQNENVRVNKIKTQNKQNKQNEIKIISISQNEQNISQNEQNISQNEKYDDIFIPALSIGCNTNININKNIEIIPSNLNKHKPKTQNKQNKIQLESKSKNYGSKYKILHNSDNCVDLDDVYVIGWNAKHQKLNNAHAYKLHTIPYNLINDDNMNYITNIYRLMLPLDQQNGFEFIPKNLPSQFDTLLCSYNSIKHEHIVTHNYKNIKYIEYYKQMGSEYYLKYLKIINENKLYKINTNKYKISPYRFITYTNNMIDKPFEFNNIIYNDDINKEREKCIFNKVQVFCEYEYENIINMTNHLIFNL